MQFISPCFAAWLGMHQSPVVGSACARGYLKYQARNGACRSSPAVLALVWSHHDGNDAMFWAQAHRSSHPELMFTADKNRLPTAQQQEEVVDGGYGRRPRGAARARSASTGSAWMR